MTKRSDRRADYRHFPPEYGEAFMAKAKLGPMTWADAKATTRELYRFRTYLMSAVEDDPSDTFARELYEASRDVSLTIETPGCFVVFKLNPIVAAMRVMQATKEPPNIDHGEPHAQHGEPPDDAA